MTILRVYVAIPQRCWKKLRATLSPLRIFLILPSIKPNLVCSFISAPSSTCQIIFISGSIILKTSSTTDLPQTMRSSFAKKKALP